MRLEGSRKGISVQIDLSDEALASLRVFIFQACDFAQHFIFQTNNSKTIIRRDHGELYKSRYETEGGDRDSKSITLVHNRV